jgi:hypothetical protein
MNKKYDNVNYDKLLEALKDIFELNCEEFNKKYDTNVMEIDYKDIDDFVVVRKSKTDYSLDYVELELSEITATIFAEKGIEKIYNDKGHPKSGRRTMKETRILLFLKSLLGKCV